MVSPEIIWLDSSAPALPAAAAWLIDACTGDGGACDLAETLCVLPGKRAGRQLILQLVRRAAERGSALIPPRTITPGHLHEHLGEHHEAIATPTEIALGWTRALIATEHEHRESLLPSAPAEDDWAAWHSLAGELGRLHRELAGGRLSVASVTAELEAPGEVRRWEAIARILATYREQLDACGLSDPNDAMERALATPGDASLHVVLIGVVDLNAMQRAFIERHAGRTTVLAHGDATRADRFDRLGCVIEKRWENVDLDLDDEQIVSADRHDDQGHAAIESIAALDGRFAANEIIVGLGDPDLGETIRRAGHWAGVRLNHPAGVSLGDTAPSRLLEAAMAWREERRVEGLAALLRHADLAAVLGPVDALIAALDAWRARHLQDRLNGEWAGPDEKTAPLAAGTARVDEILAPLDRVAAPLAEHAAGALSVLRTVYGELDPSDSDPARRLTIEACTAWRELLEGFLHAHGDLQIVVDARTALTLFLRAAAAIEVAAPAAGDAIEMLGWLELHLDPTPALILTGCNDGFVPDAVTSDSFLPDTLRRRLGLMHNDRRFARDAYLLDAIRRSRRTFTIISGRRTSTGERLTPSRLLLACPPRRLPERIARLSVEDRSRAWRRSPHAPPPGDESRFVIPELPSLDLPMKSMRVTHFRAYLACPYRFALRYLLKLTTVPSDPRELDGGQFGQLFHDVMEAFARDDTIHGSDDPKNISTFLHAALADEVRSKHGAAPPSALRIQVARLRQRLDAVAAQQAEIRRDGWVIDRCEWSLPDDAVLDVDGTPMRITGRIDRIDRHEVTGAWRIIDYKTGDTVKSPFVVHHGRKNYEAGRWHDVQLPLYRHLAGPALGGPAPAVGYITVPKNPAGVAFHEAAWDDAAIADGVEVARQVVRDIRAGLFPRTPDIKPEYDDFAWICQTAAFAGGGEGEGDDAGDDQ